MPSDDLFLEDLLRGEDCPECDEEIDLGALRFNGWSWEHKSSEAHPQAGHHEFDVLDVVDPDDTADIQIISVEKEGPQGEIFLNASICVEVDDGK